MDCSRDPDEVEIFEALISEPGIVNQSLDSTELAQQAPKYDNRQCGQQAIGERPLSARLAPGDHGREKDSGGKVGSRHPKDGELQMPRPHNIERQQAAKVDTEEALQVCTIVFRSAAA